MGQKWQRWMPYEKAKKFVHSLNLKNLKEWQKYCKSGKKPDNIPAHASRVYKDNGWVNWGDWLGTGRIANQKKEYLSFEKAREFARSLNLNGVQEWQEHCKSGEKPDNIPSCPHQTYKKKGWINWKDWLGNKRATQIQMMDRTNRISRNGKDK